MLQTTEMLESPIGGSKAALGRGARALALGASFLAVALVGFAQQPRAATFTLESGKEINGEIVYATRSAIMLKAADGAILQLSLSDIEKIGIRLQSGKVVTGNLRGWSNRIYSVAVGGRLLKIRQAKLIADEALEEKAPPTSLATAPAGGQTPKTGTKAAKPKPEVTATVGIPPVSEAKAAQAATANPAQELGAKLARLEADRNAARSALADSQKLNEKLVRTMEARAMEVAKLRDQLALATQTIESQKAALSKPAAQSGTQGGTLSSLRQQKQELELALKQSREAKLAAERALSQAEADIMGLLDDTEAYRTRAATFRLKLEDSASALQTVRQMLKTSENEKQNMQAELNEVRREIQRLSTNLAAVEAKRKREIAQAADLAKELARAKQAIEEMRSIAEAPAAQN